MINLKNIKIQNRLNYILGGSVIAILLFICIFSLIYTHKSFTKTLNNSIDEQLQDLTTLINNEINDKSKSVESYAQIFSKLFSSYKITEDVKKSQTKKAINMYGEKEMQVTMFPMYFNNTNIYNDSELVDQLGEMFHGKVAIDQRVEGGFLRVATNIKKSNGQRTVDYFTPSDSELGKIYLEGKIYITRQIFLNINYQSAYIPIIRNNEVKAVIWIAIKEADIKLLKEVFNSKKILDSGYAALVNNVGKVTIDPDQKIEGTSIADQDYFQTINDAYHANQEKGSLWLNENGQTKLLFFQHNKKIDSFILIKVPASEYNAIVKKAGIIYLIVLIISTILFIAIGRYIIRTIKKPLDACVDFSNEIANGNMYAKLDIDQKDELGQLAVSLRAMSLKIKEVVQAIRNSSEIIIYASQSVNESSLSLSNSSTEQASTIEEVSSTMEEMVSAIKENSHNAENTNNISLRAEKVMEGLYRESTKLAQSVNDISSKINIINDIAMQTNILSLNARVEAAKAGVEGRGFSVVAEEIRRLADVSKTSADQIIGISKNSLDIAVKTGEQINELMPQIKETSDLISGISAASNQQYNGAEQVNFSMQQVNESIQSNAGASEELANSAQQLNDEVHKMEELIAFFKIEE